MRNIMSPFRSHSDNHHNHNGEVAFSRLIGQMFSIEEQSNNARWSTKAPSKRTTKICGASIFLEIVFFFRHEQKNKHSFSCISGIYPCLYLLALFHQVIVSKIDQFLLEGHAIGHFCHNFHQNHHHNDHCDHHYHHGDIFCHTYKTLFVTSEKRDKVA